MDYQLVSAAHGRSLLRKSLHAVELPLLSLVLLLSDLGSTFPLSGQFHRQVCIGTDRRDRC